MGEKITAEPAFARWRYDATQHGEIACIVDLPIFGAHNQNGTLILWTTIHGDGIQATNLFWFIFIDWIGIFVFVAQQGPHFHCARCGDSQNYVVFAFWRTQDLQMMHMKLYRRVRGKSEPRDLHVTLKSSLVWLWSSARISLPNWMGPWQEFRRSSHYKTSEYHRNWPYDKPGCWCALVSAWCSLCICHRPSPMCTFRHSPTNWSENYCLGWSMHVTSRELARYGRPASILVSFSMCLDQLSCWRNEYGDNISLRVSNHHCHVNSVVLP